MDEDSRVRRTTITLESDVADAIQIKLRTNPRLKEKTLINELLRKALNQPDAPQRELAYKIPVFESDFAPDMTPEKVLMMMNEI